MTFTSENPSKRLSSELKKPFTQTDAKKVGLKKMKLKKIPMHTLLYKCQLSDNSYRTWSFSGLHTLLYLFCFGFFFTVLPLHLGSHDASWHKEIHSMTAERRAHRELTPSSSWRQRELRSDTEVEQSERNRVGGVKKWGARWKAIFLSTSRHLQQPGIGELFYAPSKKPGSSSGLRLPVFPLWPEFRLIMLIRSVDICPLRRGSTL